MSRRGPVLGTLCLLLVLAASARAQSEPATAVRTLGPAQPGEPIMIVVYTVKPDKKQQMEDYLARFGEAEKRVAASDEAVSRVMSQTRTLVPTKANADGTWTFIFLMDPVLAGFDYDMEKILAKAMAKSEADALLKLFTDSLAPEIRQIFRMTQSK